LVAEFLIAPGCPETVRIVFRLRHFLGGLFELVLKVDQRGDARTSNLHQSLIGGEIRLLAEQAHADSWAAMEVTIVGGIVAGEYAHQRRLAGTIGAN
jgi:hypothetical protein